MGGKIGGGVDADGGVIRRAHQQLLAEITQHIGHQTGVALGAVVGGSARGLQHDAVGQIVNDAVLIAVQIVRTVGDLGGKVARPVDFHVGAGGGQLQRAPVYIVHILDPDLQTAGVRVDLADHAAAQILLGIFAKADIAGLGIAQRPAVGGALALLINIEDLQTGAVGVDVGHMHRIAVAELGAGPAVRQGAVFGVEQASVMVDGCCAVHNFHAAVPINVSSRNTVVALPGQNAVHRVGADSEMAAAVVKGVRHRHKAGVDTPYLVKAVLKKVVGRQRGAGVVTAAGNQIGALTVQIGHPGVKAVHAVARLDAGDCIIAPQKAVIHAGVGVVDRVQLGAVPAEHRQVLGAVIDKALEPAQLVFGAAARRVHIKEIVCQRKGISLAQGVGVLRRKAEALLHRGGPAAVYDLGVGVPAAEHLGHMQAVILRRADIVVRVAVPGVQILLRHRDIPAGQHGAVRRKAGHHGAGRGLDSHLGPAVPVEVVHHKLGVVRSGADVLPHVQPPDQRAVQLIAVDKAPPGVALDRHIVGIVRVPLYKILVLTVIVNITHTHIVGVVGKGLPGRGHAVRRLLQRKLIVPLLPRLYAPAGGPFYAVYQRGHGVGIPACALRVQIVCAVGHGGQPDPVFIEHKVGAGQAGGVVAGDLAFKEPPADKHTGVCRDSHQSAGQRLQLLLQHAAHGGLHGCAFLQQGPVFCQRLHLDIVGDMGRTAKGKYRFRTFACRFEPHGLAMAVAPQNAVAGGPGHRLPA